MQNRSFGISYIKFTKTKFVKDSYRGQALHNQCHLHKASSKEGDSSTTLHVSSQKFNGIYFQRCVQRCIDKETFRHGISAVHGKHFHPVDFHPVEKAEK